MRACLFAPLAALLAGGLIACGGDGGGDEDPAQVLSEALAPGKEFPSGKLSVQLDATAEGEQSGEFNASVSGPFQSQGEGQVPQFDLTAEVGGEAQGQSLSFQGGLTSTGDSAYVNYQGTDYEVDPQTFQSFSSLFTGVQQQSAEQETQGPTPDQINQYLSNLENEGDEDVEGAETIHISGDLNVDAISEAFQGLSGADIDIGQVEQFRDAIEQAEFDFFVGKDDDRIRKFETTLELALPEDQGGNVTVDFSITLSELDQPQTISAPASAQPLSELLSQFGIDESALDQAIQQGIQQSPLGGTGATGGGAGGGAGGAPTPPSSGASQAYLQCLQEAQGADAVQACSSLLEQ